MEKLRARKAKSKTTWLGRAQVVNTDLTVLAWISLSEMETFYPLCRKELLPS